jgi:hypothetical protein
MMDEMANYLSIFRVLDGLCKGLSVYSGPSRAALIYVEKPDGPVCVYDPQHLLQGHEPKLAEIYLQSNQWRDEAPALAEMQFLGHIPVESLQLSGLISFGGRSRSLFYQMWFTEHHPNMCSIGPVERWLEHAAWLLAHDFASEGAFITGASRYALQGYAVHAIHDHIRHTLNGRLGRDTHMMVYPILDAALSISKTSEEGMPPRGLLAFVEPEEVDQIRWLVRFPALEMPRLRNSKHVRKLLQAVEESNRKLISDGDHIFGISSAGRLPECRITMDFRGRQGFLRIGGELACSFAHGNFQSSTRRPNLVQLEEMLLESSMDQSMVHVLFKLVQSIVEEARERKHGCTLVLDLEDSPSEIPGQKMEWPIDLRIGEYLELAKSLSKVDGALHVGADLHLHAFACLLDGLRVPGEDRSRGARFNSALRFTAMHKDLIVVVVSSDRPVSVMQGGVELTATCELKAVCDIPTHPPTMVEWLNGK